MIGSRTTAWAVAAVVLLVSVGSCAPTPEPDEPTTAAVWSGTRTEYMQALVECLSEQGWEARVETDPVTGLTVAADTPEVSDHDRFVADSEECVASLPQQPEPSTDAELRQMYDNLVARYECIRDEGYEPAAPPSFDSWLETFRADQEAPWDPFAGLGDSQRVPAAQLCPIDADAWW